MFKKAFSPIMKYTEYSLIKIKYNCFLTFLFLIYWVLSPLIRFCSDWPSCVYKKQETLRNPGSMSRDSWGTWMLTASYLSFFRSRMTRYVQGTCTYILFQVTKKYFPSWDKKFFFKELDSRMNELMKLAHEFLQAFCLNNQQNQCLLEDKLDLFLTPGVGYVKNFTQFLRSHVCWIYFLCFFLLWSLCYHVFMTTFTCVCLVITCSYYNVVSSFI